MVKNAYTWKEDYFIIPIFTLNVGELSWTYRQHTEVMAVDNVFKYSFCVGRQNYIKALFLLSKCQQSSSTAVYGESPMFMGDDNLLEICILNYRVIV